MADFETHPVGTADRLAKLEAECASRDLPKVSDWIDGALARLKERGVGEWALVIAIEVLRECEEVLGPFGAEGFDWSSDAGREAINELYQDA